MPELPEVEHFRQLLLPLISSTTNNNNNNNNNNNSSCLSISCPSPVPPKRFPSESQINTLNSSSFWIKDVLRKGKLLGIELCSADFQKETTTTHPPNSVFLFLHMGMTGRISTPSCIPKLESLADDDAYPPPHTHMILKANGHEASFSDPRRFGAVVLNASSKGEEEFDNLATDGLDESLSLYPLIGRKKGIKALLLDQKLAVSGVGNWVADEVLYRSEIHPDQNYLTSDEVDRLRMCLQSVLTEAVRCVTACKELPQDWLFRVRWDKKKCRKETITDYLGRNVSFVVSGGRSSAIVESIQKKISRVGETSPRIREPKENITTNTKRTKRNTKRIKPSEHANTRTKIDRMKSVQQPFETNTPPISKRNRKRKSSPKQTETENIAEIKKCTFTIGKRPFFQIRFYENDRKACSYL